MRPTLPLLALALVSASFAADAKTWSVSCAAGACVAVDSDGGIAYIDLEKQTVNGVDKLTERDIPSDEAIEASFKLIALPHWRWTFGMCAAYGLRPHECAELAWLDDNWIEVHDRTKTGSRRVTPCPSAWVKRFELRSLPRPTQSARTLTKVFNDALDRARVDIKPYNLRHAYALRLLSKGVSADLGARLMGHSLQVHQSTYQRWIEGDRIQQAMRSISL